MRAVNLIPTEARRRSLIGAPSRSYLVIGGLVAVLIAVLAVIMTNNKISDRKTDVARLTQQEQDAKARADALQSFSSFAGMEEARAATVRSLAQSRFDWERVLNELARVLPGDVWLTKLTGTVLPDVEVENGGGMATRGQIAGPALELTGCAPSQDAVANFVSTLEDIDGVTRVGVQSSQKPESTVGSTGATGGSTTGGGASDDCRTRDFISRFELVVAFDAAPVAGTAAAPAPTAPQGSGDTQQQQAAAAASAQSKAQQATSYVPGN